MNNSKYLLLSQCDKRVSISLITSCLLISALFIVRFAGAATTSSTVEVNIVSNINLVAQNGIVFGDISSSSIPGTVTIGTDSSRVTKGGVTVNSNVVGTPALYEVSGEPNATYSVSLPDSVVLTSASGDNMIVNKFTSIPENDGQLDSSGRQDVNIGATLNVEGSQPFGTYRGVMSTTVDYD